jgi:hypothetical protein
VPSKKKLKNYYIMKHMLLLLIAILGINTSNAQWWGSNKRVNGNGEVITKVFQTSDYDKISGRNSLDIILVEGKEGTITVEAESNIMQHLEVEVKGDRLEIGIEDGYNINTRKGIQITVTVEKISSLNMAGSGDITSTIKLKSRNMNISVAGSGDISAFNLKANNVDASIAGSGDVSVYCTGGELQASIVGSGDLRYKGAPSKIKKNIMGSGDITKM